MRKAGLPIPDGQVAYTAEQARDIARQFGKPVAVKGQVQAGGRGKAGIVKLVDTPDLAEQAATQILSTQVRGMPVRAVLVEEKLSIKKEYYCSIQGEWCP